MATNATSALVAPPSMFYSTQAIILHVGPHQQPMPVHEHCTKNSDIIKAATKKAPPAGTTRIVKLPDECPKVMAHYLGFLYGARLPTHIYDSTNPGGYKTDGYELLAHLYVLSEHIQNSVFCNVVVDEIIRLRTLKTPNSNDPKTATTHSPTTRPANIIYQGTTENWLSSKFSPTFLLELAQALLEKVDEHEQPTNFRSKKLNAPNYLVLASSEPVFHIRNLQMFYRGGLETDRVPSAFNGSFG